MSQLYDTVLFVLNALLVVFCRISSISFSKNSNFK